MENFSFLQSVAKQYDSLRQNQAISSWVWKQAQQLFQIGACQLLSQVRNVYEYSVIEEGKETQVRFTLWEDRIDCRTSPPTYDWSLSSLAAFLQLMQDVRSEEFAPIAEGKRYTRQGMMKRVLAERRQRAEKANYTIYFADNIYGEHLLINERGIRYKITLRDFENETGYCDTPDWKTNKLGTTKHIMFAFKKLKENQQLFQTLSKTYPFIEIYTDPLKNYQITWYYPHTLPPDVERLIKQYFGNEKHIPLNRVTDFLGFIRQAEQHKEILIRPEVIELIERKFDELMLEEIKRNFRVDYSLLKTSLFSYQKEGIEFATFRIGAIIADEMGLGKTIQAIGAAVAKKSIFQFKRCLVVVPASLKMQWKQEIERFTDEKAHIVEGNAEQRMAIYQQWNVYFLIISYETVLRDIHVLKKVEIDFVILDEAQKIKNFASQTANAVKSLNRRHSLVITGTPLENNLIELYSIVSFVDPYFLAPLWEFSYQYCYFDEKQPDRITGYYNLLELNERLRPILLRREKRHVLKELPFVQEMDVWVNMHPQQALFHQDCLRQIARILTKKFLTAFDVQKIMMLLQQMRMVCNSTELVDIAQTPISPKLEELEHILIKKLDIKKANRKVIIFSEWVKMLQIVGRMLRKYQIDFVEITGSVAIPQRHKLIQKFETDVDCKVFLSTEAGESGLNLQVADTLINVEIPWNPAKKNQRLGRIDRIGQQSRHLTIINLITSHSIEARIAAGMIIKQTLFEGVLNAQPYFDMIDMSAQGKAYFVQQLMEMVESFQQPIEETEEKIVENPLAAPLWDDSDIDEVELSSTLNISVSEIENLLQQGTAFLSALLRTATGKETALQDPSIQINPTSGEVVLKFRLPLFNHETKNS
ncbi:MAG: DEAD/DEAH box helicase [Cytophagales bacterium]|nr:DEAD/DEAH box helicase [Cytophagales bacterium]MDW8385172.1 DEAD/DEAH box helicase [Flammeovirgaceae bacterium]